MQDRFKFRAWDTQDKEYEYDAQNISMYDLYEDSITLFRYIERDEPNIILEQCTGCTDCSGQLIYDGDILEIPEDNGISYVKVYFNDEFLKWDIDGDTEGDYDFYEIVNRPCDEGLLINDVGVVGNIHENPELLEKNK